VLATQEDSVPATPLVSWSEVESLDGRGPFESVYEIDREAGTVIFGDGADPDVRIGTGGRIPPLVPNGGEIVALRYQHGGGKAGEVPVGAITALETSAPWGSQVVNIVAARGGRDAETLDQAKRRARKELSTRSRAVTKSDFEFFALQTPTVRVARAYVVPLRRPLPAGAPAPAPPSSSRCKPELPPGPTGLAAGVAAGAVTVVVVPDDPGPEPIPTPSFLRAVCEQLDRFRLVTTEVHVVSPQYCRICRVLIKVRALPGYTRNRLQTLVEERLGTYLHVLRGGEPKRGFPFGAQVHVADLIAQVFRTEGVERVEELSADFTRTKSHGFPREGQLVTCPTMPGQADRVSLDPEENVSIDVTTINVSTVA
jgi:predicted phage baseplate assembly protein